MDNAFETSGALARIRHCQVRLKSAFGESRQFLEALLKESEEMLRQIQKREAELHSGHGPGKIIP